MEPLVIGGKTLPSPVLMAPMCGFTDRPFRTTVRQSAGCGLAFTEMISCNCLMRQPTWKQKNLLATSAIDSPLGIQAFGHDPAIMTDGAQRLEAMNPFLIDINMGCTTYKVTKRGAGAALLNTPPLAVSIVKGMAEAVSLPVTVKIRYLPDADWIDFCKALVDAGAAAITLHARTPDSKFAGFADYSWIAQLVKAIPDIPIIGNGDIRSVKDAKRMLEETGCAGVMVGRAIRKNPWLIRDITRYCQGRNPLPPPTQDDIKAFRDRHLKRIIEMYGDSIGAVHFRKWQSQYVKYTEKEFPFGNR